MKTNEKYWHPNYTVFIKETNIFYNIVVVVCNKNNTVLPKDEFLSLVRK